MDKELRDKTFRYTKEYIARDRELPEKYREPNPDLEELGEMSDEELRAQFDEMTDEECHTAVQLCLVGMKLIDMLENNDD